MTSFPDPIKPMPLIPYVPPAARRDRVYEVYRESSFQTQMADRHLHTAYMYSECFRTATGNFVQTTEAGLQRPTVRTLVLAGAVPSPEKRPTLPAPYPGTMNQLLGETRDTIHRTINEISYNGLQPFNKTAHQMSEGIDFLDTRIDSTNEETTGSTCIGLSHALLKKLQENHAIEGMFGVQRKQGKDAFEHAVVIIQCADGYLLLDPRSNPHDRIFPIPFGTSVTMRGHTFTAAGPGSQPPIFESKAEGDFEYYTNVANGDDLVTKHFLMDSPFIPPQNPAFPVSAYYLEGDKAGRGSRTIWVSPLKGKFTLINDKLAPNDPERTTTVTFQEALDQDFRARLERFYSAGGPPTFNIDLDSLHDQLVQFVRNAKLINAMFHKVY